MKSQNFYFLHDEVKHPIAVVDDADIPFYPPWSRGKKVTTIINEPIIYPLDMSDLEQSDEDLEDMDLLGFKPDDFNLPAISDGVHPPLIRKDLLDIILSFSNVRIETFKAEIHNPLSGTIHKNYYAFNLLELAEFEMARLLQVAPHKRGVKIPVAEYPIFYLYEDGNLVVNEELKNKIEAADIEDVYLRETYKGVY